MDTSRITRWPKFFNGGPYVCFHFTSFPAKLTISFYPHSTLPFRPLLVFSLFHAPHSTTISPITTGIRAYSSRLAVDHKDHKKKIMRSFLLVIAAVAVASTASSYLCPDIPTVSYACRQLNIFPCTPRLPICLWNKRRRESE